MINIDRNMQSLWNTYFYCAYEVELVTTE